MPASTEDRGAVYLVVYRALAQEAEGVAAMLARQGVTVLDGPHRIDSDHLLAVRATVRSQARVAAEGS